MAWTVEVLRYRQVTFLVCRTSRRSSLKRSANLRPVSQTGYRLVDPQLLRQCHDEIHDQEQDRSMKKSRDTRAHFFARANSLKKGIKGVSFERNCGAASVGVLQDNYVLSTELTM